MDTNTLQPFSEEIKQYLQILWRWAWLLFLFATLGGVVTFIFSIRQPKVYQATATVLVDQQQSGNDYYYVLAVERLVQSFTKLMVQQPTLEGVIEQLGLNISVAELKRSIQVEVIPDTQLLEIRVENYYPEQAARIVNTIGAVFAEKNRELQASRYLETKSNLEAQMLSMDHQIETTSQALFEASKISETDAQRDMLQVQLDAYQEIYRDVLQQILFSDAQSFYGESSLEDETLSTVEEQMAVVEGKIAEISDQMVQTNRFSIQYDLLGTRLNTYQGLYQRLLQIQIFGTGDDGSIQPDHDYLTAQVELIKQSILEITKELNALGGGSTDSTERDRLESTLALYRQTYANLVLSYEQVRLAEIQGSTRVELMQIATPPTNPIRPNIPQNTILGFIVGLIIGGGLAFLIEMLDDTVKSPLDISKLGLPILGYIANIDTDGKYPITAEQPRSPISEAFRSLRTNIQFANVDSPLKSLLITSPTPEDGKSRVVANLATVFAQSQRKVAIIDADMRRPKQHKLFHQSNSSGLTNALMQREVNVEGLLRSTGVRNVSLLTTGALPPNPAELIESNKMKQVLQKIQELVDVVIIDTPPVTAVTDSVIMASRVDGVILVVRPGITKLGATKHTHEQLQRVGANVIGVVLNDTEHRGSHYSHYYKGYYNGYSKYNQYASNPQKKKTTVSKKISNRARKPFD